MAHDEDPDLIRIAEAVSDGKGVNWEAEQAGAGGPEARRVGHLRLIQAVGEAHGTLGRRESDMKAQPMAMATTSVVSDRAAGDAGTEHWGPLQIRGLVARGGFGEVYRAWDPALEREVALKLWRSDFGGGRAAGEAILREARSLASVRHDNVLRVYGAALHEGRVGLWTELLHGRTLEELLNEQGSLSAREAALVGLEICKALAAVHGRSLVHRDVKTSNIMRDAGGRIVLMDFGSVTRQPRDDRGSGTEPATGTPLYLPPEQILRGEMAGVQADIYALGVVLYRLVTGRFPVEAGTWDELRNRHARGEAVPLSDARPNLPQPFVQVVERAIDPDPARRYGSAGATARDLALAVGVPYSEATIPWWKRRAAQTAVAAAVAVIAVAAVLMSRWVATGPLVLEATLLRETAAGVEERLHTGSQVAPGDGLFMEVIAREAVHLYVVNEDQAGSAYVLFPAGLDLGNPLPAGRHRLPGRQGGTLQNWEVTSAGGRETFLVVASREPLEELEKTIAQVPRVNEGREIVYAPVAPDTMRTLRGIGGMAEARPRPGERPGGGRISGVTRNLSAAAQQESGIWVLQIDLENPAP